MRLLSIFYQEKPVTKSPVLLWDLRMVLDTLKRKLFEPLFTVDLKFSDVQNNVLLAFASGRRASAILALDFKSIKWLKKGRSRFSNHVSLGRFHG